MSDARLLLLLLLLHVVALTAGAGLFVFALRTGTAGERPDSEDGGGGSGRTGPPSRPESPRGDGPPLPDGEPAFVRLRGPGRLVDARHATRTRRPSGPHRVPTRRRTTS